MKIFLSYASQDRAPAQLIYLALRDRGHKVFFDRADLPPGLEYHNRIRTAIEASQFFLFLISPNAVDAGSYTLTELDIAEKAKVTLLPVALDKLDTDQLPASLQAVTFFESDGNLPGAVAAEVYRIARAIRRRRLKYPAVAAVLLLVISGAVFYIMNGQSKNEIIGKDGAPALLIPSGVFMMGDGEESPRREIVVDAFYLDKYKVTVARYGAFLKASGNASTPEEWNTVDLARDGELPVVGVDDLAGNVWEWVADWFSESFPSTVARNPKGPDRGTAKVLRGGGWYDPPERVTATKRMHASVEHRDDSVGFRCAREVR